MSSYKDRLRRLEWESVGYRRKIEDLVKETKKIYSLIGKIESTVNRINSLVMVLTLTRAGVPAAAAARVHIPLPDIITGETPPVPTPDMIEAARGYGIAKAKARLAAMEPPAGISALAKMGMVTALIPIIFSVATFIAQHLDYIEREKLRVYLDKKLTKQRTDIFDRIRKSEIEDRANYRSLKPG